MNSNLKKHYRLTRCWLVEQIDKNGKAIKSDYVFGTRKDAEEYALKWLPVKEGESE